MRQSQQSMRLAGLFLAGLWLSQNAFAQENATAACNLLPMEMQLQTRELRTDLPQYAEINYRKKLMRYVNAYYSNIAEDLLRGDGEYLNALHRLMGSDSPDCTMTYKNLLVAGVSSQDFAMELWAMRTVAATDANTAQTSNNTQQEVTRQGL